MFVETEARGHRDSNQNLQEGLGNVSSNRMEIQAWKWVRLCLWPVRYRDGEGHSQTGSNSLVLRHNCRAPGKESLLGVMASQKEGLAIDNYNCAQQQGWMGISYCFYQLPEGVAGPFLPQHPDVLHHP